MASSRRTPPSGPADADEFHLAFDAETYDALREVLFSPEAPQSHLYERGAFCVITASTGVERVMYLVHDVIKPGEGDVYIDGGVTDPDSFETDEAYEEALFETGKGLMFDRDYRSRVVDSAFQVDGAGLMYVHTHPFEGTTPSGPDRRSAVRDLREDSEKLPADAPLACAITTEGGKWSARAFEYPVRGRGDPTVTPATAVRIVDPEIDKRPTRIEAPGPAGAVGAHDPDAQDSTLQMWGADGQERLAALRVGICGAGGVGSILAEHVPRLGVGEAVIVDFDVVEEANLNRAQGATRADADANRPKAEVAAEVAERSATAPNFTVRTVDGSVVEDDPEYAAAPALLDCDVILNAADSAWARQVLDELAYAHCIPVINGGSRLLTDATGQLEREAKSEVAVTGPGSACFECQRVWNQKAVDEAREDPRYRGENAYVEGGVDPDVQPRAPSVIGANAVVAGLMQLRLMALALDVAPETVVGKQRYLPASGETAWSPTTECKDRCDRADATGGGNGHYLPLGVDMTMRYERDDLALPGE